MGMGLSLGLPAIVSVVSLVTSLMDTRLTSRPEVPPFQAFAIMFVFALAAAGIPAWFLIASALQHRAVLPCKRIERAASARIHLSAHDRRSCAPCSTDGGG
jgi:hypothetical protein